MKLRNLKEKDAPLMLEWMHDEEVVKFLPTDFESKTLADCVNFINCSNNDRNSCHLAVVDNNDTYMGTVSLKNIDFEKRDAEFAISMRRIAMGKGYARYGMQEIIREGFEKYNLHRIYWCVNKNNLRAIKFYEKGGYSNIICNMRDTNDQYKLLKEMLIWYAVVCE